MAGSVRTFALFELFVPSNARVALDSVTGALTLAWPDCPECQFGVEVHPDSGIGLDARIARIVASQHAIDSTNHDPNTGAMEFDDIDGPPVPVVTPGGRGYLINNSCGDCAAVTMLFARPGHVAQVGYGGDDNIPTLGRNLCEMAVVGRTFAWRK